MSKKENIIAFDFEGWPIEKMTLREILERLGFKNNGELFAIDSNDPILDRFPTLPIDDGMAYGVDAQYIVSSDRTEDNDIVFFREPPVNGIEKFIELGVSPGHVVSYNDKEWMVLDFNNDKFRLAEFGDSRFDESKPVETIEMSDDELKTLL